MRAARQLVRRLPVKVWKWTVIARRSRRVVLAVALVIGAILAGVVLLPPESPRRREPASLGFVPPRAATPGREAAKPGHGFAVGLVAIVRSCHEPLDVTVVAAGTAEYWVENAAKLRDVSTFRFALPGVVGNDVRLRPGTTATDVVDPYTSRSRRGDPSRLTSPGDFRRTMKRDDSLGSDLTIVEGTIRNWSSTLVPVIADFRANWIEKRSMGTCYVHLPAIAGDLSILSAQRALGTASHLKDLFVGVNELTVDSRDLEVGARYRPDLEVAYGTATVRVDNGSIDSGDSLPPSSQSVNGHPTWTCVGRARSTRLLTEERSGRATADGDYVLLGPGLFGSAGALSTKSLLAGRAGDCSAVVVAVEASAQWKRDLLLLLIGAVASLGITLLVELALRLRPGDAAA